MVETFADSDWVETNGVQVVDSNGDWVYQNSVERNYPPTINAKGGRHGLMTKKITNLFKVPVDNDASVLSSNPNVNYGGLATLDLAYDTSPPYEWAFYLEAIEIDDFITAGHTLDKAYLWIKRIYTAYWQGIANIEINNVGTAGSWLQGTITWNNQPYWDSPVLSTQLPAITADTWVIFDLKTLIQDWIDGTKTHEGLNFVRAVADDGIASIGFHSSEAANPDDRPFFLLYFFPYD